MSPSLAQRECVPCRGDVPPLPRQRVEELLKELDGWTVEQGHRLTRTFRFSDFAGALAFANRVGAIAEDQNHHPDLHVAWGQLRVEVWTHKIKGLTESDFVFAAKVDRAWREASDAMGGMGQRS